MTPHSALALARALLKRVGHGGFLPDNVLFVAGDLILWWVRPAMRHVAFRVSERDAQLLGAVERGESVPHPGLVFAASGREWLTSKLRTISWYAPQTLSRITFSHSVAMANGSPTALPGWTPSRKSSPSV